MQLRLVQPRAVGGVQGKVLGDAADHMQQLLLSLTFGPVWNSDQVGSVIAVLVLCLNLREGVIRFESMIVA